MPTASENKTTRFEYNLDGNLVKLIAENPTTGDQVTEWVYGVTVAQGSQVESKALVYQKVYPDSTGVNDRVFYQYNRQGQVTSIKDQAGTLHAYAFDKFGRILEDAVTFAPSTPLDQTVNKISAKYEMRGMIEKLSSWGTGSTPVNEVLLSYNDYAQPAKDYQSHSGPVDLRSTLNVAYSYANGNANTIRRTGITYPNGATTITMAYDGSDADDALSRPTAIKEGSATLCSYRYLGGGNIIGVTYDGAGGVELTFKDGGTVGGDPYTGLDRFGRLIETLWKGVSVNKQQSKYGRNRFSGVVWRRDEEAHAQSVNTEDNYYWYDGLYQVKERQRGDLVGTEPNYTGVANFQQEEHWMYDETGNWQAYDNAVPSTDGVEMGTLATITSQTIAFGHLIGTPAVTVGDLVQVNTSVFTVTEVVINSPLDPVTQDGYYELTVVEDTSGVTVADSIYANACVVAAQEREHDKVNEITEIINPGGNINPDYDLVGNMLTLPKAPGTATGQYNLKWDAWNRLAEVTDGGSPVASYKYDGLTRRISKTTGTETRHYYYNDQWRVVEERVEDATATVDRQYTWGLRDHWDLLRRKRSTGTSTLNEVHYCLRDGLDPVAIVGTDGSVEERYAYDVFGNVRFLAPDYTSRASSDFEWEFLFHGEFRDRDTGLYNYGYRFYSTPLGRWLSADPIGEDGGMNLFEMTRNSPIMLIDVLGLTILNHLNLYEADPKDPSKTSLKCPKAITVAIGGASDHGGALHPGYHPAEYGIPHHIYATWDETRGLTRMLCDLKSCCPKTKLAIVGHSYGGDTALGVTHALRKKCNVTVERVVTLDPVSSRPGKNGRRPNSHHPGTGTTWTNIYQSNTEKTPDNTIAGLGGHWGAEGGTAADQNILDPNSTHASVFEMLRFQTSALKRGKNGPPRSILDVLRSERYLDGALTGNRWEPNSTHPMPKCCPKPTEPAKPKT